MAAAAKGAKYAASSVPDSKHSAADPYPDPSFPFDADQGIRILLLIYNHWSTDPPLPNVLVHGSTLLHFEPPKLLNCDFDVDPAFHSDADPDPLPKLMRIYRFLRIRTRIRSRQPVLTSLSLLLVSCLNMCITEDV